MSGVGGSSILTARYTMEADVYRQVTERSESGQTSVRWIRHPDEPTIKLIARPILGGGIRVVGSIERWEEEYLPVDWIKFQTNTELSKRYRLYNIRDIRTGRTMWEENEDESESLVPMWFDVVGVMPIADPFGRLLEYDSLAKKVQDLDLDSIEGV